MAATSFSQILIGCNHLLKNELNGFSSFRKLCLLKCLCANQKYTAKLVPEVGKVLDTGEVKHRKHPGIRKTDPFILPEVLKTAVSNLVTDESKKVLMKDARTLCTYLMARSLPMESSDILRRIKDMVPSFEGKYEVLPEILNAQELKVMKRRINSEIGRWKPIEYNPHECRAYLLGRLPANYASTCYVFKQLQERIPSFQPTTYFDFGSGVGSSLWAAHSFWSDTIKEYFCVDVSADMNELCQNILTDQTTEETYIKTVFFRQFLPASETIKYDLVVSAFTLLDLPSADERLKAIDTLWRKTKDVLVLIELGTFSGFHCIIEAKDYILKVENDPSPEFSYYSSGAYVVSPCPHDSDCPKLIETYDSTCGFIVPYKVQFSEKFSQVIKKDWISYVILRKGPRPKDDVVHPRLVKPVLKKAKHVYCHMCCADGKLHEIVVTKGKHGRHVYRCARESHQGDMLPVNIVPVETSTNEEEKSEVCT